MGTCYYVAVRTGQDTYDAYDVDKNSALVVPFWERPRPQTRSEYVELVRKAALNGSRVQENGDLLWPAFADTWLHRAANHLWAWLSKYVALSANVRVFNDCSDDYMTVGGAQHRGGFWRPGIPLVDVKSGLDAMEGR